VAIAALGFAIGGGATDIDEGALTDAYRITMLTAAALAGLSSVTAAITIAPQQGPPKTTAKRNA
jgi:hypothetical protein